MARPAGLESRPGHPRRVDLQRQCLSVHGLESHIAARLDGASLIADPDQHWPGPGKSRAAVPWRMALGVRWIAVARDSRGGAVGIERSGASGRRAEEAVDRPDVFADRAGGDAAGVRCRADFPRFQRGRAHLDGFRRAAGVAVLFESSGAGVDP
ncbi:hypothetical protein D3C85_1131840 [compost metagenome]